MAVSIGVPITAGLSLEVGRKGRHGMPIPDFQTLMFPVLQQYADGQPRKSSDVRESLSRSLKMSAAGLEERLPSGRQSRFGNRPAWAHSYLKQASLIDSASRGVYRLS